MLDLNGGFEDRPSGRAASETRPTHIANSIRGLCDVDLKDGFVSGENASLPETNVYNPENHLGGKPGSKKSILAFFAGSMHGYLRPILLQ
ncbi:hypothetical protein SADUNF_Sadunf06G0191400 [Salix dunnii]|uniref:Uncharacterized protein n=1 Tax=Salix dunnii TaxID=1413687 RepID=A0A835MXP6_9ROSI|nr:hypothetical protein SADUNF_Sadunf06G0191400 [Salix dunnii]